MVSGTPPSPEGPQAAATVNFQVCPTLRSWTKRKKSPHMGFVPVWFVILQSNCSPDTILWAFYLKFLMAILGYLF